MKTSLIIACLLITTPIFSQVADYAYTRKISGINQEWHRVVLPDDLFEKVQSSFGDLRFIGITSDKDTIEAPYYVQFKSTEVKISELEYRFVDLIKTTRGYEYTFVFDAPEAINRINLSFSEANYDWEITVEGSHNGKNWNTVVEDYRLLQIKNNYTNYAFDRIDFEEINYRYLRITVPLAANPVVISPRMVKRTVTEGKKKTYVVQNKRVHHSKKEKQTIIDFETPHSVPLSDITLSVKEKFDYYRPIHITYLSDSVISENGVRYIYRDAYRGMLSSLEKAQFDLPNERAKKYRITIENNDNQPLNIDQIQLRGYVYEAIVRFNTPADYTMIYGNPAVSSPNYDITYFKDRIPENPQTVVLEKEIMQFEPIEEPAEKPFFTSNWWLYGIMGVVVVLLGGMTLKMMRKEE